MNFGDSVFVSARLRRFRASKFITYAKRKWERVNFSEPRKAIYIGYRTLANGHVEDLSGYGNEWVPTEYVKAALVIFNERENPVYAFFEDIETEEGQKDRCRNMVDMEITAVFKHGITKHEL